MNVNVELSRSLQAEYYLPMGACWFNAKAVVQVLIERGVEAEYVEGRATPPASLTYEHAWAEANGQIIDPTWARIDDLLAVEYVPARRWCAAEIVPLGFDEMGVPMDDMMAQQPAPTQPAVE